MRGGGLMKERSVTENELVCWWRVSGGSDSCIDEGEQRVKKEESRNF